MRIHNNIKFPKVLLVLLFVLGSISLTAQTYGPLLTDVWGGVNCKDDNGSSVYPLNYYTPNHCSPGCVAISLSQVLHYYEWPITGVDNNVYAENYNGTQFRHMASFDGVEYDWDNMQDEYYKVASSDIQRKAVGELVYHCDIALEMNFEPSGSTSNVNRVPGIQQHFRFSGHYKEPDSYSAFWTRMRENLKNGHPVQVAVGSSSGSIGHAFVIDGYRESDGFYHVNWGWWDKNNFTGAKINLWYDVENGHLGLGYDEITGAVFDFFPVPQISSFEETGSGNSFTVSWITSDMITNEEYTLEQKIDGANWTEATVTTDKSYTVNSPTGKVYQFRVKAKTDGAYYSNSWSETETHAVASGFNGYATMDGTQAMFAYQT
ncbi:MAG: C10 family peptidase, partial [Flavobacteriales bacterium]|nr:C10 family peptidase [Flavobacteriales bacterium]